MAVPCAGGENDDAATNPEVLGGNPNQTEIDFPSGRRGERKFYSSPNSLSNRGRRRALSALIWSEMLLAKSAISFV